MPWTEKQRKYFHAAASRGTKGMAKLADEADQFARVGGELPPTGVGGGANHIIHTEPDPEDSDRPAWERLHGDE